MPSAGLAAVIFPSFYGFVPSSHSSMPDPSSLLSRANHLTVAYAMEVMRLSLCLDRQPKKRAAVLRPELIVWQLTESPGTESSVCGPTERACLFPHKTALHCSIRWTQKLYLVLRQSGRRKIHCSRTVWLQIWKFALKSPGLLLLASSYFVPKVHQLQKKIPILLVGVSYSSDSLPSSFLKCDWKKD